MGLMDLLIRFLVCQALAYFTGDRRILHTALLISTSFPNLSNVALAANILVLAAIIFILDRVFYMLLILWHEHERERAREHEELPG